MIVPMNAQDALQIAGWAYENEYSLYSIGLNSAAVCELMNGEYYAATDKHNNLIGYFCFGESARIPAAQDDAYSPEMLDIGLGMRPDLCGRGKGYSFLKSGLHFAKDSFDMNSLRLTVAAFNIRAIRVYERIGFKTIKEVTHRYSQKAFEMMTYTFSEQ